MDIRSISDKKSYGGIIMELSPKMQNDIMEAQQLQQQLQTITTQKYQLETQKKEVEVTLEELSKIDDKTPVYRNVGNLSFRVKDIDTLKKELEEKKETLEVRIKSMERQEEHIKERYSAIQQRLTKK